MFEQMLSHMTFVDVFNWSVLLVFSICYIYQFYYVFVVLTRKPPLQEAKANHKYAVMISARNESQVIGDLIHSIRVQNYPQELISIFVIADNCTDNTAEIARNAGATEVYERFNDKEVGKGYALNYGWHEIQKRNDAESFEAYFEALGIVAFLDFMPERASKRISYSTPTTCSTRITSAK